MQLLFVDESGYSSNWKNDLEDQPYFVLSGFMIDADQYVSACEVIREEFSSIKLEKSNHPIGQGFEIKAKEIAKGNGWWKKNPESRSSIRDLMLSTPNRFGGVSFLVIIDKKMMIQRYSEPEDPVKLSLRYLYERVQKFLDQTNQSAVCIFDQSSFRDDEMHATSTTLTRDGSYLFYLSFEKGFVSEQLKLDRIKEFYLTRSENSIGIQVADYFATFGYQYVKSKDKEKCNWWALILGSLHNADGKVNGIGLKTFP